MNFVPCDECALRQLARFKRFSAPELAYVKALKSGQIELPARQTIIEPGAYDDRLYTLYSGWAFRYRLTSGGQRQIIEVLLPGSLIGLQQLMLGHSDSGVESLTPVTLCVLSGRTLKQLFVQFGDLSDAMVLALMEDQRRGDTRLALVSRLPAPARLAYFLLELFDRLVALDMVKGDWCYFPLQRRHIADLLGLSDTHVSRSMKELRQRHLASIDSSSLSILDRRQMTAFSGYMMPEKHAPRLLL
ncbi:MAG: Crp/Fnr family transcriptional regulator [Sphingomonadales bacterium]|jgi:CRP-like cAMP-binding protein|nr:MAG: Crp/Fnr family transcriptional regulator [Sphingomonadales bacterium]